MKVTRRSMLTGGAGSVALGGLGVAVAGPAAATGVPAPAPGGTGSLAPTTRLPTLKLGMSGTAVRTLQTRLSAAGYWLGAIDGSFGTLTLQAVYAIQKAAGLTRDGIVGPTTWAKVNVGYRPSRRTTSGHAIEVDKGRQILKVIRNGQLALILNTSTGGNYWYTSSDGTKSFAVTPSGSFSVWWWYDGMQNGSLGQLYRPRYFNGSIAVHGSCSVPPYPASHGCCRVTNQAMDMGLRNYMRKGTRVLVY